MDFVQAGRWVPIPALGTACCYPENPNTSKLKTAKAPLRRIPAIAIQVFGSLRRRLRNPNTTPMTAGSTRIRALSNLSMPVVNPERKDSNRVRIQSVASEMRNRRSDVDARLDFIFFSFTNKKQHTCYTQ
jgi:hypothetical protein